MPSGRMPTQVHNEVECTASLVHSYNSLKHLIRRDLYEINRRQDRQLLPNLQEPIYSSKHADLAHTFLQQKKGNISGDQSSHGAGEAVE